MGFIDEFWPFETVGDSILVMVWGVGRTPAGEIRISYTVL
jgi:hypothetical protein